MAVEVKADGQKKIMHVLLMSQKQVLCETEEKPFVL